MSAIIIVHKQESKESNGRILALILEAENLPLRGKGKTHTYAMAMVELMAALDTIIAFLWFSFFEFLLWFRVYLRQKLFFTNLLIALIFQHI